MTSRTPTDGIGRPLSDAIDRMDRHEQRRAGRRRVDRTEAVRQQVAVMRSNFKNLVQTTGQHMADVERDLRKQLDAEPEARAALERQIESLRGELATARTLADPAARLDRLEAPPAERSDAPSRVPAFGSQRDHL